MHLVRCIAKGGFKINGPPKMGKGPMSNEKDLESSNEASLPQPTQAGRIEICTELISKAMRCLENNDKDCVMRKIEYLIKNNCHNGYAVGREAADEVRELVHELWLISDSDDVCGLLIMLRDLNISRNWVRDALGMNTKTLDKWLVRCGIDWESKAIRNGVVKVIESLLRERFGWDEVKMCEEMWRFIGVDVDEFRRHGIEPCSWLISLEGLGNLRHPYWLGLRASDLTVKKLNRGVELELKTSNSVDVVFFLKILSMIKTPSLKIKRERGAPGVKYVHKPIELEYYIDLGIDKWPWPIELNANELKKILNGFSDEGLAEFIAGEIDGDGDVGYHISVYVEIMACKACPKRCILDVLKEIIARRFGIVGSIESRENATADALVFRGKKAVRLLRRIVKYIYHPIRRLRTELILALHDGIISPEEFERLYNMTKYEQGGPDIKRNHALETLIQAAPQTHTHGEQTNTTHKK